MSMASRNNILVWLPSPMGDAIMATPALKTLREHFARERITFYAGPVVRQVLTPTSFSDGWLEYRSNNPLAIAGQLRKHKFTHAILMKNSFLSAMAVYLARIPDRIGYCRECRGIFLTKKLLPPRNSDGSFKPGSMIDYYNQLAATTGAGDLGRSPLLEIDLADGISLERQLGALALGRPLVILVPGGALGPSKIWPGEYFARTADYLAKNFNARIVISVAPNEFEKAIADRICALSSADVINLARSPLTLGELKALFAKADLVIGNDTGPRHIAIALGRKLITLFGPNNPEWTITDYPGEVMIRAELPCVPCDKPRCNQPVHCMTTISVETVCAAAAKILGQAK
jgi:heptosyltransferase-2